MTSERRLLIAIVACFGTAVALARLAQRSDPLQYDTSVDALVAAPIDQERLYKVDGLFLPGSYVALDETTCSFELAGETATLRVRFAHCEHWSGLASNSSHNRPPLQLSVRGHRTADYFAATTVFSHCPAAPLELSPTGFVKPEPCIPPSLASPSEHRR